MADALADFLAREYEYLRGRNGRDFFLALGPYTEALNRKRPIRSVLMRLQEEMQQALNRFVGEQNVLIAEAARIRNELAQRAPEIDNSDMQRPDPATHAYARWEYNSFARFDDLVDRDARLQIGYPRVPSDHDNPGVVNMLLQILRGRLRAAQYGEDASIADPPIRRDLGDLGTRLGNLGSRHDHALSRYRQEARTLPGLALLDSCTSLLTSLPNRRGSRARRTTSVG